MHILVLNSEKTASNLDAAAALLFDVLFNVVDVEGFVGWVQVKQSVIEQRKMSDWKGFKGQLQVQD